MPPPPQLRDKYGPSFATFTAGVTMPLNVGETDYDALMLQLDKRFSQNYSVRVSYTLAHSRGNTSGNGVAASGFQVLDDMHLDLNEGPTNFDQRHNFVVSGTALIPHTGGLNFSWVARALSGTPFSLTNGNIDPDRNGTIAEPLEAGDYSGTGADAYTVNGYRAERNGAYGPGFFQTDLRAGYRFRSVRGGRVNAFVDFFNVTDHVNFANPSGNQAQPDVPGAHGLQHELHAAKAAARRALRVLGVERAAAPARGPPSSDVRRARGREIPDRPYTQSRWVLRSAGSCRSSTRYRRQFALGLLCVIITTTIQLLSPWVLKFAIDDLTAGVTRRKLAFYAGTMLGIACVGAIFRYLMRQILIGASRDIEYDVRNEFFARLQQMPLAYYQARRTGDLMSRATNDLNAVRMMIGPAVMYSANTDPGVRRRDRPDALARHAG